MSLETAWIWITAINVTAIDMSIGTMVYKTKHATLFQSLYFHSPYYNRKTASQIYLLRRLFKRARRPKQEEKMLFQQDRINSDKVWAIVKSANNYSSQSKHEATFTCNTGLHISVFPSCYFC